ncbi:GNAT family N-acetyltransferase [Oryzisolibacter sp. LB2S]|uniref:GNAT family N-acetyltransferase n=1 Tax=Alicycliphilus soli TaxID=3228789 RepID=UPI00345ADF0E
MTYNWIRAAVRDTEQWLKLRPSEQKEVGLIGDISGSSAVSGEGSPLRVRFKFLLGELVLGEWRPTFIPVVFEGSEELPEWPALDRLPPSNVPPNVAGYQLRRTFVTRFPRGVSRQGPWLCYSPRREYLYFVSLRGSFDEYLKLRSPKSRQNLKRSVKKFLEKNPEAFRIYTEPESMEEFHRDAVSISSQTYQTLMLKAGLPDSPEFLRAMREKASKGEARGYLLRTQEKPIAFAWCTAKGDAMTYQVIGYLPEYAESSPGTVLLYLILQDLFSLEKYRMLDFGPGSAFYKEAFATGKLEFADSYLLHPTLENRWKLWLLWKTECFSTAVGSMLDRIGLKKKIRQWMRKSAQKLRTE